MKVLIAAVLVLLSFNAWAGDVQVFSTDKAPKRYIVIGELSAEASSIEMSKQKLTERASNIAANAILNFSATGERKSFVSKGVAVRWVGKGERGLSSLSSDTAIPVVTLGKTDYKDYEDYQKKIKYYRTRSWIDFGVGTGLYVLTAAASVGINSKNTLTFVPIFGPIIRGCQSGTGMSKGEAALMIAGGVLQLAAFSDMTYSLIQKHKYTQKAQVSWRILPYPTGVSFAMNF